MILNVLIHESVTADIDHGKKFYEIQKHGLGSYFEDTILSDIESLLLYGGVHSKRFNLHRMFSSKFPFAVYYDVQEQTAVVLAVLDMRKNPHHISKAVDQRS